MLVGPLQLAQILAARLSYASYKVARGWIQQNINEIEHLQASRFSEQAERRKALKGKGRATALDDPKVAIDHLEHAPHGPFSMLADPYGQAVLSGSTGLPTSPRTHHFSQSGQDYLDPHPIAYQYHALETQSYPEQLRTAGVTPPPQEQVMHPSPSMYSYLASPLAPSGPWSSMARPESALGTSKPIFAAAPVISTDFWRNGTESSGTSANYQHIPNGMVAAADVHTYDSPGAMPEAPPAYQNGSVPANHAQYSLLPAASIPAGVHPGGSAQRGHGRNRSLHALRGEYSASNVTMDDLDSHFQ